jgi:hypothetical protein
MITAIYALGAFTREHEYCGELASDVDDEHVWMTRTCGASIVRELQRFPEGCR